LGGLKGLSISADGKFVLGDGTVMEKSFSERASLFFSSFLFAIKTGRISQIIKLRLVIRVFRNLFFSRLRFH